MAGNKINTKKREDKSKIRNSSQVNEDIDDIDFSLLRKPILTSVTGFCQAKKIFEVATEEVKGLISNECDLLYECKVCRNIFRSLVNFVSHKRIYCKENFNSSVHGHFLKTTVNELCKLKLLEQSYEESLKEVNQSESTKIKESEERIPLTKDLSTVIERIAKNKAINNSLIENQQVILQKIPKTSVAVFQNITYDANKKIDSMRAQVQELNDITSRDNAVLEGNGKIKIQSANSTEGENVIQISDDDDCEDTSTLKCKLCDQQFSTQKTLKVHIKYKHLENRLVYPCPDCLEIFSTSWSVYRHLFKVHRKSAAQIRRLRESIQAKAFRMNNPPAFYEKKKSSMKNAMSQKKTEDERLDQENQEWMDSMEGDGELPRCGGCGRTFERRAALAAHTNTCQPRSRALARRPQETKKVEIQIRKDYNKGPSTNTIISGKPDTVEGKAENNVSTSVPKDVVGEENKIETKENNLIEAVMSVVGDVDNDISDNIADNATYDIEPSYEYKFVNNLPYAYKAEKSNVHALKLKMQDEVVLESFLCKKCDMNYSSLQELLDHMASHYKWMRYGCKLCNFKHYEFEKLPEHIKTVHKLKGDADFYYSTLKAIDGSEALEMSDMTDEVNEESRTSPDSRRPSRCSSDSSRLSDDSSSSSIRIEGSRKRKINLCKTTSKKKKEATLVDSGDDQKEDCLVSKLNIVENDSSSNSKTFEENSSDIDESEEKTIRQTAIKSVSSVASRRPVRNKTKPKYKDFEYDLSNLLKMEAQGYRDSQGLSIRSNNNKRKSTADTQNSYDIINKEYGGALAMLSRKSVEKAKATLLMYNGGNNKGQRLSNIFAKPLAPKIAKTEKVSPKKELIEIQDEVSPIKEIKQVEMPINEAQKEVQKPDLIIKEEKLKTSDIISINKEPEDKNKVENDIIKNVTDKETPVPEKEKSNTAVNVNLPKVFPFKFKPSLDVMKNPLIKKNLTDFTKAGMKTKILVIKPINRNKDGTINTPLKFQTIKLKEPKKDVLLEEKRSDQVVVVPVPKVDSTQAPPSVSKIDNDLQSVTLTTSKPAITENVTTKTDNTGDEKVIENSELTVDVKESLNQSNDRNSHDDATMSENIES